MRVFALSDIHVDYPVNMTWISNLSDFDYTDAALILAGDATHHMSKLEKALTILRAKFASVHFVPGNHELWVQHSDSPDSIDKFNRINKLCARLGVYTQPVRLGSGPLAVWLVPLFSWYVKPEEGEGHTYVPKPGEDPELRAWSDNYFCKWPALGENSNPATWFLGLNRPQLIRDYDAPVISFSHFLPRRELIFSTSEERKAWRGPVVDAHPTFNFSMVAGDTRLDEQLRAIKSKVHVYGHQHRNRYRTLDGVLYISHCLGYNRERETGFVSGIAGPRLIWANGRPAQADGKAVAITSC